MKAINNKADAGRGEERKLRYVAPTSRSLVRSPTVI